MQNAPAPPKKSQVCPRQSQFLWGDDAQAVDSITEKGGFPYEGPTPTEFVG